MKKWILFFVMGFILAPLQAQEVQLVQQSVPDQVSFAQPFDVNFALSYTPGYTPVLDKEQLPQGFTLTHEKLETRSPGTADYQLTFIPFTLGVSTFTAVNIELQDGRGQTVAQVATDAKQITVQPVRYFKEKTMRDIRPPYIPIGWFWWILCAFVLVALIGLLRRFGRRVREHRQAIAQEIDNRPPDVIALSKIRFLLQSGLWENKQYKAFYIELSEILREYFWRRFQLDVSADTSAELLRRVRKVQQLQPLVQALRDYLNSSDLVKFARVTPTQTDMQHDVKTIEDIVRSTTPLPTEEIQEEK